MDDGDPALGCQKLTTRISYEPEHNGVLTDVRSTTDAMGNTMTYANTYDSSGKLTQLVITPPANSDVYTITYTFDQYGERIDKDVTIGNEITPRYHFEYGYQNGLLSSLTNAFGSTNYYYTLYGERKGVLDANNVQTNNMIDNNTGYLTAVGSPEELSSPRKFSDYLLPGTQNRFSYGYDVNGNKLTETDSQGNVSYYNYNELNLLVSSLIQTAQSECVYDPSGNLINVYDSKGNNNISTYDAMNRRIQVKTNMGNTPNDIVQEETEYDGSGRIKVSWDAYKVSTGHGNRKEYYYDSADNLLCMKYYDKNGSVAQSKYTHDANGNILTKDIPLSAVDEKTGRIVTNNQYDALNRLISITISCALDNQYNQTVSYTYEAGQLKTMTMSVINGCPKTTTYIYDAAMRLDSITNQTGQMFQFKYFPGGQRRKKSMYKKSTDTTPFMTVKYAYDEAYLLKTLDYKWGDNNKYYVTMSYNYHIYNGVEKITENQVDYNLNSPDAINSLCPGLNYQYPIPLISGTFTNKYSYDNLGRLYTSDDYRINPSVGINYTLVYSQVHQQANYTVDNKVHPAIVWVEG